MSHTADRLASLEALVETLRRRVDEVQYAYPARKQDAQLALAVDRAGRRTMTGSLDLFDDVGAAAAVAVTLAALGDPVTLTHGGTGADMHLTGGTDHVVRQTSVGGVFTTAVVQDAELSTSDVTTNNVSTSKHGFHPKLDGTAAHFMDGTGSQRALTTSDVSGLGTSATHASTDYLLAANNLSDVTAATARTNLGLTVVATASFGTGGANVCVGNDSRLSDARTPTSHGSSHLPAGGDPVFTQGAAVADASGGVVIDAEARTALNALLARMRAFPLIAT